MPGDPANHLPAASLRVSLHRAQPFIDLELTIINKAKDNWPEADWLCLPFKLIAPQFSERQTKPIGLDRKSTRLNSSHQIISYAVFCLKKKNNLNILSVHIA